MAIESDWSKRDQFVEHLLANSRDSLKWGWQIVMAFSLVSAVMQMVAITESLTGATLPTPTGEAFANLPFQTHAFSILLFVFVFLPTFVRFYFGDSRYLDQYYYELTWAKASSSQEQFLQHELQNFTGRRRLFDIIVLLSHGIFFVFMGRFVSAPRLFIAFFTCLLLTNSLWLFVVTCLGRHTKDLAPEEKLIPDLGESIRILLHPSRDFAPQVWIANNTFHSILILILTLAYTQLELSDLTFLSIASALCVTNSVIDLRLTWKFYFPDVYAIYMAKKARAYTSDTEMYHNAFKNFLAHTDQKDKACEWMDSRLIELVDAKTLIDAGAGSGELTAHLAEQFKSVIAIEPNPFLRRKLRNACPKAKALQDNILTADIPPNTACLVICSHVFYYLPQESWAKHLQRIASWIRPGGRAWIILQQSDTDCMKMLEKFRHIKFDLLSLSDAFLVEKGDEFEASIHRIESYVTANSLSTTYEIAEFMLNLFPMGSSGSPPKLELEEYIRNNFEESATRYRFSCSQNILELRRKDIPSSVV